MDFKQIYKDVAEFRQYISNSIMDVQCVCTERNEEATEQALYALADACKDLMVMCGYHMVKRSKYQKQVQPN